MARTAQHLQRWWQAHKIHTQLLINVIKLITLQTKPVFSQDRYSSITDYRLSSAAESRQHSWDLGTGPSVAAVLLFWKNLGSVPQFQKSWWPVKASQYQHVPAVQST